MLRTEGVLHSVVEGAKAYRGIVEAEDKANVRNAPATTYAILDAIIKKEEHTGPYIYSLGNGYLANKQYDLAIQKFDEAISLGGTNSYYSRGMAWLEKHDNERAIADFTEAAKTQHGDYFIYIHRAEANEKKGDRDSAISDYRQALALNPDETIKNQINAALKRLHATR